MEVGIGVAVGLGAVGGDRDRAGHVEQASRGALGDRAIAGVGDPRVELDAATGGEHRTRVCQDRLGMQRLSGRLRDLDLVGPGSRPGCDYLLLWYPLETGCVLDAST